jgi:protein ImuB
MRVLFVHLPLFPIQHHVLGQPQLKGRALALVEEVKGQRRVAFASPRALGQGIVPGQTLSSAMARLPELVSAPFQTEESTRTLRRLGEQLLQFAPAFEACPFQGLWLDAGAAHLRGGEDGLLRAVVTHLSEQGYLARAVAASQLFTARAVAEHRAGCASVAPGEESKALAPLPLSALPWEAGVHERLAVLGLERLGDFAGLPAGAVAARLGAEGERMHRLARGQDDRLLVPTVVEEEILESLELGWPAESLEPLLFALKTLLDRICARLMGRRLALLRLGVRLGLDGGGAHPLTVRLTRPSTEVRLVLGLLRLGCESLALGEAVTRVTLTVEESCSAPERQLTLGDGPAGDAPLEAVLARLATSLGEGALASPTVKKTYVPEAASGLAPFRPGRRSGGLFDVSPGGRRDQGESGPALTPPWQLERPARLLPVPEPLEVRLGTRGELVAARVGGTLAPVLAVAGPEKIRGNWWAPEALARDYFRVVLESGSAWVYRDARDGRYFLHGYFD